MLRVLTFLAVLATCACTDKESEKRKPTGTPTDPVEVCERPAQVCKYKGSQLGVCVHLQASDPRCEDGKACHVCAPQH